MNKGKITVVIGGQWGSESKGLFCSHLALNEGVTMSARTGSINAGHTVYFKGEIFKNQQIPVAWVNPEVKLVIGAGAYVNPQTLKNEIDQIEKVTGKSLKNRLFIDLRAGLQDGRHREQSVGRHEQFGTVGEGCSAAICERLRREKGVKMFRDTEEATEWREKHFQFTDTIELLNEEYDEGGHILIEGTQGTLLDVYLGDYPFTTSRQTVASSWLAECGLAPTLNIEVAMVCRTYPIRVAGNSGPMPNEINWVKLAREINSKRKRLGLDSLVKEESLLAFVTREKYVAQQMGLPDNDFSHWNPAKRATHSTGLVEVHKVVFDTIHEDTKKDLLKLFETTTVTKKLRRIAELDIDNLKRAVRINRPTYIVLNFLNYSFPSLFDVELGHSPERATAHNYVKSLEAVTNTPIKYINWAPNQICEYNYSGGGQS